MGTSLEKVYGGGMHGLVISAKSCKKFLEL